MGLNPAYKIAAESLGESLANRGIELVYGAGNCGLMGVVADSVLENGGKVIGVIPKGFTAEVRHKNLTKTIFTENMAERKLVMEDLSDAFIAMSGGIGTLDEIFQTITLCQLRFFEKPSGFLNIDGFYDKLFEFLKYTNAQGFIPDSTMQETFLSSNPDELLDMLENFYA